MLPKLEHFPVNWVDGMKIARKHFTQQEYYVSDHIRDSVAVGLNSFNYGLLPSNAPEFNLLIIPEQNQHVRVQLFNCRAVTGAGCRVEILDGQLSVTSSLPDLCDKYNLPRDRELEFLVVLSVNLFTRQPLGIPTPDEQFTRPPFSVPTYKLSIEPSHLLNAGPASTDTTPYPSSEFESNGLIIGKLKFSTKQLYEDKNYIPACTSVSSHTKLAEWANKTSKLLAEIQVDAVKIVAKVCEKRGSEDANKVSTLAEFLCDWAQQLAAHLDEPLNQLAYTARQQPPINLLQTLSLTTRRLRTTIACLNSPLLQRSSVNMGKDLILNYFKDWTGITKDQLMSGMDRVIDYRYDHANIRPHLEAIDECWMYVYRIVHELTKLEYIGQGIQDIRVRTDTVKTAQQNMPHETATAGAVNAINQRLTSRS